MLLPQTVDDYIQFASNEDFNDQSIHSQESIKKRFAETTIQKRSVEWIKQHGICLDNTRPQQSIIPGAGRGAFAERFIPKGDIVIPVPLFTVMNKDALNVEETAEVKTNGKQLLLNYCFGNMSSKVLLCPQTNAVLVNHCSTRKRQCGKDGPNAEIRWGERWDPDTTEWLKLSMEELGKRTEEDRRGLSIEIVAIRDIAPGEEVFIDYGERWEMEFDDHVEKWEPPSDDGRGSYVPVRTMIENKDFRTLDELVTNPYPSNVQLVCIYWESDFEEDEFFDESKTYHGGEVSARGPESDSNLSPCEIVEKSNDGSYVVRIFRPDDKGIVTKDEYPEENISFRMRKYSSDMHLAGAFRHMIEISDGMFPAQWMERRVTRNNSEQVASDYVFCEVIEDDVKMFEGDKIFEFVKGSSIYMMHDKIRHLEKDGKIKCVSPFDDSIGEKSMIVDATATATILDLDKSVQCRVIAEKVTIRKGKRNFDFFEGSSFFTRYGEVQHLESEGKIRCPSSNIQVV